MECVHAASRHTGASTTHIVSSGLVLSEVSSCCQRSGPAKPYLATSATPFCSPVVAFHPSALRTLSGDAQTLYHDSARPSATTEGSASALLSSACIAPAPHALSGCDGSVQLVESTNGEACPGNALTPLPDRTFQNPTLTLVSAAAAEEGARPIASATARATRRHVETRRDRLI